MVLHKLTSASLAFGVHHLLDRVDFQIEDNERVCIIGRNGTGKTSLLNIIAERMAVDSGEVWSRDNLRVSYLEQNNSEYPGLDVYSVVASGLPEVGELLAEYHRVSHALANSAANSDQENNTLMQKLSGLQEQLEHRDGWNLDQKISDVCTRLDVPVDDLFDELSGGTKRRVLLAKALACDPELLILDEPTNHLDIDRIQWLEEYLLGFKGSLVFVTHDRSFLQNLATRIVELDRGNLTSYPGNYAQYEIAKQKFLEEEQIANAKFDKRLAEEERWIRQGIKARRTRNEGRVTALEAMRQERGQRRDKVGNLKMNLSSEQKSGKIVVNLDAVSFSYPDEATVIQNFTAQVMRKDRIGIIGPNGCGKSTLIKLLLNQLEASSGTITRGTKLDTLYYDQQRDQLDQDKSVIDNLGLGTDSIMIGGRARHAVGYLQDFLFSPQRIHSPVRSLSGGEQNRLLLARLFTKPANFLILDEPTNDLDVESLELLEDLVGNFDGTIILVSHDRAFLDNIVTSTWVFEGGGVIEEFVGGYSDWQRQMKRSRQSLQPQSFQQQSIQGRVDSTGQKENSEAGKLTFKEKQELEKIPGKIEKLEAEKSQMEQEMAGNDFYKQDEQSIKDKLQRLELVRDSLSQHYQRWEVLENRV